MIVNLGDLGGGILGLWLMAGAFVLLHRLSMRYGRQLVHVSLGALAGLYAIRPVLMLSCSHRSDCALSSTLDTPFVGLSILGLVIQFALLAVAVSDGFEGAARLALGLSGLTTVASLIAAAYLALDGGNLIPLGLEAGQTGPGSIIRWQLAGGLAFGMALYVQVVFHQLLQSQWKDKAFALAASLALLAAAGIEASLFSFFSSWGTADGVARMSDEITLKLAFAGAMLPVVIAHSVYLRKRIKGTIPGLPVYVGKGGALEERSVSSSDPRRGFVLLEKFFHLLADASSLIVRAKDQHSLMDGVCNLLVDSQDYKLAWIGLVNHEDRTVEPAAKAGREIAYLDSRVITVGASPKSRGPIGTAVREARPAVIKNIGGAASMSAWDEGAEHHGFRSCAAIPMSMDGRVFATMAVYSPLADAFEYDEVRVLQALADDLAFGLSRLRLEKRQAQRMAELEALRKASLSVTSSLDLRAVLETILTNALDLAEADDAHIFLYDGVRLTFGAALWAGNRQSDPFSEPRDDGLTYSVARSGKRVVISNVNRHELFKNWHWGGAIAGLPLRIGPQVVGVMNVAMDEPRVFDESELRVIELLADHAAIAIANARLFEGIDAERGRVQLLLDVTQALADTLEPQEILARAIGLATKSLQADTGGAFLLEPETGRLRHVADHRSDRITPSEIDDVIQLRLGKGLEGWVAENKTSALVVDVEADDRWIMLEGSEQEIRSAIVTPIMAGERVMGVLSIVDRNTLKPEQLESLEAISRQVGLALSNAERYQQTVRRLTELALLQQVASVVNQRLEMQPLIEEVVYQVGELLGYPIVEVFLVEGDELVLCAAWGGSRNDEDRIPIGEGIVGMVARTDEAYYAPDVSRVEEYIAGVEGINSEIAVPLRAGNLVVGVLNVESPELWGLTRDDQRFLTLLADQVSIAIENAALYERQRREAELLEKTVRERTAELADALMQAEKANILKSQFVSDVSHEIRTPLSNIRLYVELMAGGRQERFEGYLDTLQRETDRLIALIDDLLALSRLDAGTAALDPVPIDLNRMALTLVDDRKKLFAKRDLTLEFIPEEGCPEVVADERMLSQVLANLMTNALHYTPSGGKIEISTQEKVVSGKCWITLTVSDNGQGIELDEHEHIFERFYRGSAGKEGQTPGTGLGLAICKEILDLHQGRITLVSEPGEGSAFTIWLNADKVNLQEVKPA